MRAVSLRVAGALAAAALAVGVAGVAGPADAATSNGNHVGKTTYGKCVNHKKIASQPAYNAKGKLLYTLHWFVKC